MPTQVNPTCYHESASSIGAFQKCPTLFRLQYREGLRLAKDTESQRVGTAWHKLHEIYANALDISEHPGDNAPLDPASFSLDAVIDHLNERYSAIPRDIDPLDWAVERQILLTCFIGYQWYWSNDPIEALASELPFNLPMHMPKTGLPLPMSEVQRVGKIDHIIRWQGVVGPLERKSTSRSIDPNSDYWDIAKKDTQVSMYALAIKDGLENAEGLGWNLKLPADTDTRHIGNTLYDVWHRPTIKPKMLTQADTAEFIESEEYCGQKFAVVTHPEPYHLGEGEEGIGANIIVNDVLTTCAPGKKGFAIRETPEMYGARLLADIYERPEFYFARKEIVRTDADLQAFRQKAFAVYQTKKLMEKHGCWYENEKSCRSPFPCPMLSICYGIGADAACDGKTTPDGFKRIFVDLTVEGSTIESET